MNQPGPGDVEDAARAAIAFLEPLAGRDWSVRAGDVEWSCEATLRHMISTQVFYAAHLATRSPRRIPVWRDADPGLDVTELLANLAAHNAILAAVIRDAPADARGFHIFGRADRSGFAAMACDEVLVHTYDIALGFGQSFVAPPEQTAGVVARLFPWAPAGVPAWDAFLWCNGRTAIPGHARLDADWVWWSAPLDEWDGVRPPGTG